MSRGLPALLPAGRELASWLRAGPAAQPPRRLALWAYRWRAYWFDANWRRQQTLFPAPDFAGDRGRNLVFVLGFWRSGTTLLHELLACGPRMAAPRTWQCMNPSGFRIGGPPASSAAVARPMDALSVSALSPQEDEFALLARGAPSAYRAWLDPRRWREALPALRQETWLSLPAEKWLADWRTFLGWCMPEGAGILAVKSPNHAFRLRALHRAWPKARLAWTLRDPVDTWQSNRKMWRAMTATYGLWDWQGDDLDRLLLEAMTEYAAALRWAAESLGSDTTAYVDFDRLARDTAPVLRSVTARLDLGSWEDWLPAVQPRLEESAKHPQETYAGAAPLPHDAAPVIEQVRELHARLAHNRR